MGCLGDVCIHMVPCSGRDTTPWGPWAGSKDEAGVGWVVSVGAGHLGTVPNSPTSARHCCWRSCAWPGARPTRPPSMSSTTCWPALTAPCGELGERARPPSWEGSLGPPPWGQL